MAPRILLCDDEPHVLRAAQIKFQRAGYEVSTAADGEEAWQMIIDRPPSVVITDCQMPRLDGLGLAKRIHESVEFSSVPVFMLTAKGFELSGDQIRADFGIHTLFSKPFSPRRLLAAVEELLQSSPEATSC